MLNVVDKDNTAMVIATQMTTTTNLSLSLLQVPSLSFKQIDTTFHLGLKLV